MLQLRLVQGKVDRLSLSRSRQWCCLGSPRACTRSNPEVSPEHPGVPPGYLRDVPGRVARDTSGNTPGNSLGTPLRGAPRVPPGVPWGYPWGYPRPGGYPRYARGLPKICPGSSPKHPRVRTGYLRGLPGGYPRNARGIPPGNGYPRNSLGIPGTPWVPPEHPGYPLRGAPWVAQGTSGISGSDGSNCRAVPSITPGAASTPLGGWRSGGPSCSRSPRSRGTGLCSLPAATGPRNRPADSQRESLQVYWAVRMFSFATQLWGPKTSQGGLRRGSSRTFQKMRKYEPRPSWHVLGPTVRPRTKRLDPPTPARLAGAADADAYAAVALGSGGGGRGEKTLLPNPRRCGSIHLIACVSAISEITQSYTGQGSKMPNRPWTDWRFIPV
jgi:hypothetical protein